MPIAGPEIAVTRLDPCVSLNLVVNVKRFELDCRNRQKGAVRSLMACFFDAKALVGYLLPVFSLRDLVGPPLPVNRHD